MMKNLDQFVDQLCIDFSPKQKKVLFTRFGLKNGKRATLQEIGNELGVTRERVRQIEAQAAKKLGDRVRQEAGPLLKDVVSYLENAGGVRRDEMFISEVKKNFLSNADVKYTDQKLRFLFVMAGVPFYAKEDDRTHAFWYSDDQAKKKFFDFVKQAVQFFKTNGSQVLSGGKVYLARAREFSGNDMLLISKEFGANVFGDVGLVEWAEIEPRTIRDKAYLVLKKNGAPLHFADIAKSINTYGIDEKPAHTQTVHNELIKDKRFVLVGRGMYALREQGYEGGTVREVIARILKKHGPLGSNEVVSLVNQQRILKLNTILLGLQNRRYFKRVDDGKYHIKEA